ncbi:MAG: PAS domain S-box protein, partial [Mariprofundaceae bacterium]|nr:PAS domain S-box protein [Mariprofundaceae bacterium]
MKMLRSRYFIRILFPIALLLLLSIGSVGLYITQAFIAHGEQSRLLDLESLREAKVSTIVEYINDRIHQIQGLSYSPYIAHAMHTTSQAFEQHGVDSAAYHQAAENSNDYFHHYVSYWDYYDLFLINREGDVVYSVKHESDFTTNLEHGAYRDSELAKVYKQAVFFLQANNSTFAPYPPSGNQVAGFLAAPIIQNGVFMGVIALQINTEEIYARMTDLTGLGRTGETVAGHVSGSSVQVTIPLRHDPQAAFQRHMSFDAPTARPIIQGSQGHTGHGIMNDWRGESVLATWEYLPQLRWGIVSKIDQHEAMEQDFSVYRKSMLFLLLALIAAFWLAYIIARRVVVPVTHLSEVSRRFSAGDHQARVNMLAPSNELAILSNDINTMMDKVAESDKKNSALLLQLAHQNEVLDQTVIDKTARLTAVIQYAVDAIITLDMHGKIGMVNPAACQMFDYDEDTFLTLYMVNLFSPKNPCDNTMQLIHYIPQHDHGS